MPDKLEEWAAPSADLRYTMSNSIGFGGHNVSLIIGCYEE